MYQNNYNGYQPQYPRYQNVSGLKGRPVSSLDEAKAATVDFDGSIYFFPDIANRMIYTKQINLDGTALLNAYEFVEIPKEDPKQFVTRNEFDENLAEIKNMLKELREPVLTAPKTQTPQF